MSFKNRLEARYQVRSEDEQPVDDAPVVTPPAAEKPAEKPGESDTRPGSAHPDNWQTSLQSGKSVEEIRQEANALSAILISWQSQVLQAQDYFTELTANSDKYLHMFNPILIKGLSREKLETMANICIKFSKLATIVR
jgi:hypothetical protein